MKEKYLSKEYTNCLRGIFSIVVLIHHLWQYTGLFIGTYIATILQLMGTLSVAMFFFMSGYGLMFSSQRKNYIDTFFVKRFLPLYCFHAFLAVFYAVWRYVLEGSFSPELFIQSFFFGGTIVINGWYLQTTFVIYLLYWFIFKSFKSIKTQLFAFTISIFCYCILCRVFDLSIIAYQSVPCVILGMIWCLKKDYIDKLLKKYAWAIFVLCGILFAACFVLSKSEITVIFNVLYLLLFVCSMVSLSYILANTALIQNRFNSLLGDYSLEIYVTHGLFLKFITIYNIENIYVYICIVLVGTVLMSMIMKKIHMWIVSLFKKAPKKLINDDVNNVSTDTR